MRVIVMLISLLGLVACAPPQDTRPGQPVFHRQEAFKAILRAFEPMGVMLKSEAYQPEKFLAHTNELMSKRDAPWSYFMADTNYPPTKAKEAVWTDSSGFEAGQKKFFSAAAALQVAAESRQENSVRIAYAALKEACDSCHKTFKK